MKGNMKSLSSIAGGSVEELCQYVKEGILRSEYFAEFECFGALQSSEKINRIDWPAVFWRRISPTVHLCDHRYQ